MLHEPEVPTEAPVQKNCGSTPGPHRFKPGNTLGEVIQLARELSVDAVRSLHKIATKGKSERARIEAAVALLDRAYGRPKVQIENEGNPLTITAIRQIIASPDGGETICPPIFGDGFVEVVLPAYFNLLCRCVVCLSVLFHCLPPRCKRSFF